jgi:hypothetical protein
MAVVLANTVEILSVLLQVFRASTGSHEDSCIIELLGIDHKLCQLLGCHMERES